MKRRGDRSALLPVAVLGGALLCGCAPLAPMRMVRVVGSELMVPADASDELEIAALKQRAARDLGCAEEIKVEHIRLPLPIVRARGCEKKRLYLRVARGSLPGRHLGGDPRVPVDLKVVDFVDIARAQPEDPFAGLDRLSDEVREEQPGRNDAFSTYTEPGHHDHGPAGLSEATLVVALNLRGAKDLPCPRDEVIPMTITTLYTTMRSRRDWIWVMGCGRSLSFEDHGYFVTPKLATHPLDVGAALVPWVPIARGDRASDAVILHVASDNPGEIRVTGHGEHVCDAPCDMPLDPHALYRVEGGHGDPYRRVVPSDPFRLPEGPNRVTAVVNVRHDHGTWFGILLTGAVNSVLAGGLFYGLGADAGVTGMQVLGGGAIAMGVGLGVAALWVATHGETTVCFEK